MLYKYIETHTLHIAFVSPSDSSRKQRCYRNLTSEDFSCNADGKNEHSEQNLLRFILSMQIFAKWIIFRKLFFSLQFHVAIQHAVDF